jgi:hypothetical protein
MPRSPKQHQKDGDVPPPPISKIASHEIKPILKESSSSSMKIAPRKQALSSKVEKKPPCKKKMSVECVDEEEYEELFIDIVRKELPKVNEISQDSNVRYTVSDFQDDIVCVISDIYETCNYLLIPDQEMLSQLAKEKIDDKDLQALFVYGKDGGMMNSIKSCHEKIKDYSMHVRRKNWDDMCDKFSKIDVDERKV